jgi:hypothetical protein
MIALVALRPVRLKNTALIELNRHVRKHGDIWRSALNRTRSRIIRASTCPGRMN